MSCSRKVSLMSTAVSFEAANYQPPAWEAISRAHALIAPRIVRGRELSAAGVGGHFPGACSDRPADSPHAHFHFYFTRHTGRSPFLLQMREPAEDRLLKDSWRRQLHSVAFL